MDAILPVNKPAGITSYDVIRAFKRAAAPTYKVGHGGTLDPFAEGVLLLLLGKATKKMNELSAMPKTYRAASVLGARSDTLDVTGEIVKSTECRVPSEAEIHTIAATFVGKYEQEIPDYSAAKVNGQPRYEFARKGIELTRKTKWVEIYNLEIEEITEKMVTFSAQVSSGTYIRQLAYDIFSKLGMESYLKSLVRTAIGDFSLEKCASIEMFKTGEWQDKAAKL